MTYTLRTHLSVAAVSIVSALVIFDSVLFGHAITNNFYLFAYEPWAHYMRSGIGNYNYMLSDDVDAMSLGFPTAAHLRSGMVPLWNHYWQLGLTEFRIDSGWFYPLRIFWLLFDIPIGMTLEVLVRHSLAVFFSFLLLESFGISFAVALVTSLSYAYGSTAIGDYMFGFGPISLALPIALYFLERLIQCPSFLRIIPAVLSWCYLNSHIMIHVNFLACIWLFLFLLCRLSYLENKVQAGAYLILSVVLAVMLSAFFVLPTLHHYLHNFNSTYREGYAAQQINPISLLTIFYNSFFGIPLQERARYFYGSFTGSAVFIGFLTGCGSLCFSVLRYIRNRDQFIGPALVCTVALMLTVYQFPHENIEFFYSYIPLVKYTPPYYQRPIFQFFLMVTGALGLEYFSSQLQGKAVWRRYMFVAALYLLVTIICYLLFYQKAGPSEISLHYFYYITAIHLGLLSLFCLLGWVHRQNMSRWIYAGTSCLIFILCVAESKENARGWIPYIKPEYWYYKTESLQFLKSKLIPGERVVSIGDFAVPAVLFGDSIPVAAGRSYPSETYLQFLRAVSPDIYKDHPTQSFFPLKGTDLASPIWSLLNVNYFLASKTIDKAYLEETYGKDIKVHSFADGTILERIDKGRLVTGAGSAVEKNTIAEIIDAVSSRQHRSRQVLYTLAEDDAGIDRKECGRSPKIKDVRFSLNRFVVMLENRGSVSECSSLLRFSMFYDKGWSATVDGKPTRIDVAYGMMPTIRVNGLGEHTVVYSFFPPWLGFGIVVSLAGVVGLGLVFVLEQKLVNRGAKRTRSGIR